jgi:hypothetical protein
VRFEIFDFHLDILYPLSKLFVKGDHFTTRQRRRERRGIGRGEEVHGKFAYSMGVVRG